MILPSQSLGTSSFLRHWPYHWFFLMHAVPTGQIADVVSPSFEHWLNSATAVLGAWLHTGSPFVKAVPSPSCMHTLAWLEQLAGCPGATCMLLQPTNASGNAYGSLK